ncbi:MAG: hypothetical protein KDA53_13730 [Hyphomonas sp.]|nr:hypothetical protein [Hyphomonas sp.]
MVPTVLGAIAVFAATAHFFNLELNVYVSGLYDSYDDFIRRPIQTFLRAFSIRIDGLVADAIVVYFAVGGALVRSEYSFIKLDSDHRLDRRLWRTLRLDWLLGRVPFHHPKLRPIYYFLSALFWPMTARRHVFRAPYLFVRQGPQTFDDPYVNFMLSGPGIFTSTKKDLTLGGLFANRERQGDLGKFERRGPHFYHPSSQSLFCYFVDLRKLWVLNLAILIFIVLVLLALGSIKDAAII